MIMPGAKCHLKVQFRSNLYAENRNISFKEHWTFGKKKKSNGPNFTGVAKSLGGMTLHPVQNSEYFTY